MANIPLSRSEVFGELRKELHDDKEFHESDAHVFIIMGASVRPALLKCANGGTGIAAAGEKCSTFTTIPCTPGVPDNFTDSLGDI